VGQSEVEAAALVDTLVYVANPGTGDWPFMRRECWGSRRLNREQGRSRRLRAHHGGRLEGGMGLGSGRPAGTPGDPDLGARHGDRELVAALCAPAGAGGAGALRRRRRSGELGARHLERRFGSYGLERAAGAEACGAARGGQAASSFSRPTAGREIETPAKPCSLDGRA
jgi:hypothetical protein